MTNIITIIVISVCVLALMKSNQAASGKKPKLMTTKDIFAIAIGYVVYFTLSLILD